MQRRRDNLVVDPPADVVRGAARANNVGWRIDYQIVTPSLHDKIRDCAITPSPRFSDHAPYTVDYAIDAA